MSSRTKLIASHNPNSHNPIDECGKETQTHYTSQYLHVVTCKSLHSEILPFIIVYQTKHFLYNVPMVHISILLFQFEDWLLD